jgi:hypothetical protein
VVAVTARIPRRTHKKLAAVILATKYERHMQVYRGLSGVVRMWSSASENTMQNAWMLKDMKDAVLKEVSV